MAAAPLPNENGPADAVGLPKPNEGVVVDAAAVAAAEPPNANVDVAAAVAAG